LSTRGSKIEYNSYKDDKLYYGKLNNVIINNLGTIFIRPVTAELVRVKEVEKSEIPEHWSESFFVRIALSD